MVKENCKQLYSEPYMTPNNFDISFNDDDVPKNIKKESFINLTNRLQKIMPTSKIIHLQLEGITMSTQASISIVGALTIGGKKVEFL